MNFLFGNFEAARDAMESLDPERDGPNVMMSTRDPKVAISGAARHMPHDSRQG